MLHVDSGYCVSICTARCLPVLHYGELGGESKREGFNGRGCLCSRLLGGRYFSLLCFDSVADYRRFQPLSSLSKYFCVKNPWPRVCGGPAARVITFRCPNASCTQAFQFFLVFCVLLSYTSKLGDSYFLQTKSITFNKQGNALTDEPRRHISTSDVSFQLWTLNLYRVSGSR